MKSRSYIETPKRCASTVAGVQLELIIPLDKILATVLPLISFKGIHAMVESLLASLPLEFNVLFDFVLLACLSIAR